MKRLLPLLILLSLSGATFSFGATPAPAAAPGPLVLISIDGFRWDYMQKYDAPNLSRLAAEGVHATRMTSCFPSITFPNHYSIVTGLYPEHHGIVGNSFYDPVLKAKFFYTSHACAIDPRWWSEGEPIWITAEKQGVRSACFFWPGSETKNHGLRASFVKTFDKHLTDAQRVDGLLQWIGLPPDQRPRFATLYFNIVDTVGHESGPDSPEMAAAVKEVDAAVGRLLAGLDALGLGKTADLVFVSDHGMSNISLDRTIVLDDYADPKSYIVDFSGTNAGLRPTSGTPEELLAKFQNKSPYFQAYLRDNIPARFNYRTNPRISPVVLVAEPGWEIFTRARVDGSRKDPERGDHGWDPATPEMGALFIAHGPAFRHAVELPDVANIDIYNLLCSVLGVKPAPNDGDQSLVHSALAR